MSRKPRPLSRAAVIVLDGVGVGEMPDAAAFGDTGANTLGNAAEAVGGLALPWFGRLGLGNIISVRGTPPAASPLAGFGLMAAQNPAKDTSLGHWELMGLVADRPFPLYPAGFPPEIILPFERAIGRRVLGNVPASGTEIIERLGAEHLATGSPIVYTSADSVFQIAAHVKVVPTEELYDICRAARALLVGEHAAGRVIARPFAGEPGAFYRTGGRRDFSLPPPGPTLLDHAAAQGFEVRGVGKIGDIFAGRGLTSSVHTVSNEEGLSETLAWLGSSERGLLLANLVDFDTLWGHRNDPAGFARCLQETDAWIPRLLAALGPSDVLVFTADHGCDPTTPSTDHSREHVPLLVTGPGLRSGVPLGRRESFADLGATLADFLGIEAPIRGQSFARLIS